MSTNLFLHDHLWLLAGALGALIGSFLNVVIHRLPRGASIAWPGSRCPSCETPIKPWDNIPLVSYLLLRGRCRLCKGLIGWRYPMVEALCALLFALFALRFGHSSWLVLWMLVGASFIALSVLDLMYFWLPDKIVFPTMMAVATWHSLTPQGWPLKRLLWALLPAALLWGLGKVMSLLLRRQALGFGDIKLVALMGWLLDIQGTMVAVWFGALFLLVATPLWRARRHSANAPPQEAGFVVMWGTLLPTVAGVALLWTQQHLQRRRARNSSDSGGSAQPIDARALPFGPFLILGTLVVAIGFDDPSQAVILSLRQLYEWLGIPLA